MLPAVTTVLFANTKGRLKSDMHFSYFTKYGDYGFLAF